MPGGMLRRKSVDDQVVDVLIYSADAERRRTVIEGTGVRPSKGSPRINWIEAATASGAIEVVRDSQPPIAVLDGETPKVGGMAVARQIRNQLEFQPLIVLMTARPQDDWLAEWAGARFVLYAPYDPLELQRTLADAIKAMG